MRCDAGDSEASVVGAEVLDSNGLDVMEIALTINEGEVVEMTRHLVLPAISADKSVVDRNTLELESPCSSFSEEGVLTGDIHHGVESAAVSGLNDLDGQDGVTKLGTVDHGYVLLAPNTVAHSDTIA